MAVKIGAGVKEFSTRKAMYNTRSFEIRRVDGSATDFSVKPCLDGKARSVFAETLRALRTEVVEDIKKISFPLQYQAARRSGSRQNSLFCRHDRPIPLQSAIRLRDLWVERTSLSTMKVEQRAVGACRQRSQMRN